MLKIKRLIVKKSGQIKVYHSIKNVYRISFRPECIFYRRLYIRISLSEIIVITFLYCWTFSDTSELVSRKVFCLYSSREHGDELEDVCLQLRGSDHGGYLIFVRYT